MKFSNNWFSPHRATWEQTVPPYQPRRILEIGSFEGQSICFLIELLGKQAELEIYCVDTWEGGREHVGTNMSQVEEIFDANASEAIANSGKAHQLFKIKGDSAVGLSYLLSQGKSNYFDMIYIDGSHETPDVFSDAALSYRLLRIGGLMIFDDYIWGGGANADPIMNPKMAIDCFLNCYQRKMQMHPWLPLCQMFCRKIA